MKLQHLAIIFLVITIPLMLIMTYYINLQRKTLKMQADYDIKLSEATKEGIKSFEVNTVDFNDIKTADRRQVEAMINSFITSLANKLNISGTAREYMITYLPAIAVTMYDGYYIYSPSYVPKSIENDVGVQLMLYPDGTVKTDDGTGDGQVLYEAETGGMTYSYTDSEGNTVATRAATPYYKDAIKEYKHILNSKIAYSEQVKSGSLNVIIDYTLDNRIYVYGLDGTENVEKDGYLVNFDDTNTTLPRIEIDKTVPDIMRKEKDIKVLTSPDKPAIPYTVYAKEEQNGILNKTAIQPEKLLEKIAYYDENGVLKQGIFNYVYDIEHEKLYYDITKSEFFIIKDDLTRSYLGGVKDVGIKADSDLCRFKSISLLVGNGKTTEYKKIYQALNGKDMGKWYISLQEDPAYIKDAGMEEIDTELKQAGQVIYNLGLYDAQYGAIYLDYSAISYYVESYAFTNWVEDKLGSVTREVEGHAERIFKFSRDNDPDERYSPFTIHKREIMQNNIVGNLSVAITYYRNNGSIDYKIPELSSGDWEQVFSNISMITFFQGVKIGLKTYNNYAIATSTNNREYVDPTEIYFRADTDEEYHRPYCEHTNSTLEYTGYRSVEYTERTVKEAGTGNILLNYYQHEEDHNAETGCYYCIVNKSNYAKLQSGSEWVYSQAKSYNEALARERYYQYIKLKGKFGIRVIYMANLSPEGYIVESVNNINPNVYEHEIGDNHKVVSMIPSTSTWADIKWNLMFVEWNDSPDGTGKSYKNGDMISNLQHDIYLYAQWAVDFQTMEWIKDYYWVSTTEVPPVLFDPANYRKGIRSWRNDRLYKTYTSIGAILCRIFRNLGWKYFIYTC